MSEKRFNLTISDADLERIKRFRLMDDSFMEVCFKDNKEAVELVLKIILKKDLKVIEVKTQDSMKKLFSRAVRLDIVAVDSEGTENNKEIQRSDKGGSAKRARYNSSMLDVSVSEPGDDFADLPETYVIFITEHDIWDEGCAVYEFVYENKKTHRPLNDGSHIIYVNNEYRDDSDIGRLMSDFAESDPDKMNYEVLAKTTRYFKESEKGVSSMCRIMDEKFQEGRQEGLAEGRQEGRQEGLAEGLQEGKLEVVLGMMNMLHMTSEQALHVAGIPESEYGKYEELIRAANA